MALLEYLTNSLMTPDRQKKLLKYQLLDEVSKVDGNQLAELVNSMGGGGGIQAATQQPYHPTSLGDLGKISVQGQPQNRLQSAVPQENKLSDVIPLRSPNIPITPAKEDKNPTDVGSALGNFMQSVGYAATGHDIDASKPQAGWQTYLGSTIGNLARKSAKLDETAVYNTPSQKWETDRTKDLLKERYDVTHPSVSGISSLDINKIPKVTDENARVEILASLPPDVAENVQAAGEYRLDATKVYGLRNNSGDRAKFDALINRLYPGWDMKKYSQRQKYQTDLATGKLNQQVTSLNTLAKHLVTFEATIDSLKNTNLKPKNAVINMAKDLTGDPTITDFNYAKEVVYGELQRAVTGVGVTQEGMKRVDAMLSQNAGYDQMKSNVKLLKDIVNGRLSPLRSQYKNIMGEEENGQILFPESQQIFSDGKGKETDQLLNDKEAYEKYLKLKGGK